MRNPPKKRYRLTNEDKVNIRLMRLDGKLVKEIAEHFGMAESTISGSLRDTSGYNPTFTSGRIRGPRRLTKHLGGDQALDSIH
jgi:IS30 family transposase